MRCFELVSAKHRRKCARKLANGANSPAKGAVVVRPGVSGLWPIFGGARLAQSHPTIRPWVTRVSI